MEERRITRSVTRVVVRGDGTLDAESQRSEREEAMALVEAATSPDPGNRELEMVEETPELAAT